MKDKIKNFIIIAEILSILILLYFTCGTFLKSENYSENIFTRTAEFFGVMQSRYKDGEHSESIYNITYPLSAAIRYNGVLYGSAGNIAETKKVYQNLQTVIAESVGSMNSADEISESEFCSLLKGNMICFYFDGQVPLFLVGDINVSDKEKLSEQDQTSFIMLSADKNEIVLCYRNQNGTIKSASTAAKSKSAVQTLSEFAKNNAYFAFEDEDGSDRFLPETLIMKDNRYCAGLSAEVPVLQSDGQTMLAVFDAFGYNPYTMKKYSEKDETQVYVQDLSTIKVTSSGSLYFSVSGKQHVAENTEYDTDEGHDHEMLMFIKDIKTEIDNIYATLGMPEVYLKSFSYDDKTESGSIAFGYETAGIPVITEDKKSAAEINFEKNKVVSAYINLRKYQTVNGETNALVPFEQVKAVINADRAYADEKNVKISAMYKDDGGQRAGAHWFITLNNKQSAVKGER